MFCRCREIFFPGGLFSFFEMGFYFFSIFLRFSNALGSRLGSCSSLPAYTKNHSPLLEFQPKLKNGNNIFLRVRTIAKTVRILSFPKNG